MLPMTEEKRQEILAQNKAMADKALRVLAAAIRLCGMRSLGSPFAAPLSPDRTHNPDVFLRAPLWRQRLRTWLGNPNSMTRVHGRMRGWDRN